MGHLAILVQLVAVDVFQNKRVNKSNIYKWNFKKYTRPRNINECYGHFSNKYSMLNVTHPKKSTHRQNSIRSKSQFAGPADAWGG